MSEFIECNAGQYIPSNLKLFKADLLRLGKTNDGGYVVDVKSLESSTILISFGYGHEFTFEEDYLSKMAGYKILRKVLLFDGSISLFSVVKTLLINLFKFPYRYIKNTEKNYLSTSFKNLSNFFRLILNSHVKFSSQYIGSGKNQISLQSIITSNQKVFLKMDIEGNEYNWLLNTSENDLLSFKQIVMEFHGINDNSWGASYQQKFECFKKLSNTHYLIHIHGNNCGHLFKYEDFTFPVTPEITLVNKNKYKIGNPLSIFGFSISTHKIILNILSFFTTSIVIKSYKYDPSFD